MQTVAQRQGGCISWCPVLILKVLVLQRFFGLSDQEIEFQMLDRFSFLRFLGLRPVMGRRRKRIVIRVIGYQYAP
jgi:hypothetical protein